ncbi:MAG: cytidylate kinase family protein [Lachnospiraceae bacterium]
MKFRYITIEREYGSGGTKIGCELSKVSKVPCYGREILEAVAKKRGITEDQINRYEGVCNGKPSVYDFCHGTYAERKSGYADGRRKDFPG